MKTILTFLAGVSLAAVSGPVMATNVLTFNGNGSQTSTGKIYSDGTVQTRVSAWSIDPLTFIHSGSLGSWPGGLGIINGKTDNSHTIDNSGSLDFLVLQFDKSVTLAEASFQTGWQNMYDTDATIGYANWSGAFDTTPGLNGKSAFTALSDFSFYNSGSVGQSGNSVRDINPNEFSGNTWIIGASFNSPDKYADGFKLSSVSYDLSPGSVPEPSTWAMLLLGFGALGSVLRARTTPARRRATA